MGVKRKPITPRRMFAPEEDGFVWGEFADDYAGGVRRRWCEGSTKTWAEWRKERPTLRIIRVVVSAAVPS